MVRGDGCGGECFRLDLSSQRRLGSIAMVAGDALSGSVARLV